MKNFDVTQNITSRDLICKPFPYFYIKNALPWDIYEQLSNEYPETHMMQDGKTIFQARRYRQHEFESNIISSLWQDFIEYHTSQEFKDRVLNLFDSAIKDYYPLYQQILQKAKVLQRRDLDAKKPNIVATDLQYVLNGLQEETVRTAHLDNPKEIFAGLFYMRKNEDNSIGGDLQLYRRLVDNVNYISPRQADPKHIELVETIPYRANHMILFLNTPDSIHGVTPRLNAKVLRRYVNISAHLDRGIFHIKESEQLDT